MREQGIVRIEIHVAGVFVAHPEHPLKVLALHRAQTRTLFPDLWEGVGGQVHDGESLEDAVERHLWEEAGLRGRVIQPTHTYVIEPGESGSESRIPGVRFLGLVKGTPSPRLDPRQHQGWQWLEADRLDTVPLIPGLREQFREALRVYADLRDQL